MIDCKPCEFRAKCPYASDSGRPSCPVILPPAQAEWVPMPATPAILVVDRRDPYVIQIGNAGDWLLLIFPYRLTHRGAGFAHPNLIRSRDCTLWLKRGSAAGREHVMAVRRSLVEIKLVQGWSYATVRINGMELVLDVSGGSFLPHGWTDYVHDVTGPCLDEPLRTLKAVADVAERCSPFEGFKFPEELEEEFYAANAGRLMAIAAWGDWHESVPQGMVGVCAQRDGPRGGRGEGRWFLVSAEEYTVSPPFVIDESRHKEFAGIH
jgi:hypothetical protein